MAGRLPLADAATLGALRRVVVRKAEHARATVCLLTLDAFARNAKDDHRAAGEDGVAAGTPSRDAEIKARAASETAAFNKLRRLLTNANERKAASVRLAVAETTPFAPPMSLLARVPAAPVHVAEDKATLEEAMSADVRSLIGANRRSSSGYAFTVPVLLAQAAPMVARHVGSFTAAVALSCRLRPAYADTANPSVEAVPDLPLTPSQLADQRRARPNMTQVVEELVRVLAPPPSVAGKGGTSGGGPISPTRRGAKSKTADRGKGTKHHAAGAGAVGGVVGAVGVAGGAAAPPPPSTAADGGVPVGATAPPPLSADGSVSSGRAVGGRGLTAFALRMLTELVELSPTYASAVALARSPVEEAPPSGEEADAGVTPSKSVLSYVLHELLPMPPSPEKAPTPLVRLERAAADETARAARDLFSAICVRAAAMPSRRDTDKAGAKGNGAKGSGSKGAGAGAASGAAESASEGSAAAAAADERTAPFVALAAAAEAEAARRPAPRVGAVHALAACVPTTPGAVGGVNAGGNTTYLVLRGLLVAGVANALAHCLDRMDVAAAGNADCVNAGLLLTADTLRLLLKDYITGMDAARIEKAKSYFGPDASPGRRWFDLFAIAASWTATMTPQRIKSSFKNCGMWPIDVNRIDVNRLRTGKGTAAAHRAIHMPTLVARLKPEAVRQLEEATWALGP
ncbi:hypothetical protein I4F81_004726 [Pyropia yezoensis]|uniref:Uncharacterized protein n=1 Tax=Pyropia yezoensis TaxID=2788 RepID=A0ACC3BW87_PYRYE|nr:hypothetical protein I4F81_004726 [Neopyropia yezoensis]